MVFTFVCRKNITSRELFYGMKVSKKKLIIIQGIVFLNIVLFQCSICEVKETSFPRNIELLSSLIDSIAHTAADRLELCVGDTVCIVHSDEDSKVERFILDRFYRVFSESGFCLFFSSDSVGKGLDLSLSVCDASVVYQKYLGRSIFRQGRVLRRAEMNVSLRAVNSRTGKLVWAGNLSEEFEDQVPVSRLRSVEEGSTIIGRPLLPREGKLRRFFEPIVVLGVMGVVTSLFYLIRSS